MRCKHTWIVARALCEKCGALGCYREGSIIMVAMKCGACGDDAVQRAGDNDYRCQKHRQVITP